MNELTTLQAAALCDVKPSVVRSWIADGLLKPTGYRMVNGHRVDLFDEKRVHRLRGFDTDPEPVEEWVARLSPLERLADVEAVEVEPMLPTGLDTLRRLGRFEPAPWGGRSLGGASLLGKVRFGSDWLRVYRSWSGVVYHEQAEWMEDDPDWMDTPAHAETYALLEMAA